MPETMTVVERRLATFQAWVIAGVVFMLVVGIATMALAVWVDHNAQKAAEHVRQQANADLACFILPSLERSEKTLSTLAYYKEHPAELHTQLRIIQAQRDNSLAAWGACPPGHIQLTFP